MKRLHETQVIFYASLLDNIDIHANLFIPALLTRALPEKVTLGRQMRQLN
jgi:hypothetical protein